MKTFKLAFGIVALSISAHASAMPEPVPDRWYDQMWFRIGMMTGNPGFCKAVSSWWCS